MALESLMELEERMKSLGIECFNPDGKRENIMMVEAPVKVIDIDRKEVLYYAIIKIFEFDEKGVPKFNEQLYYTILDEDTVNDMFKQISDQQILERIKSECNTENMYV